MGSPQICVLVLLAYYTLSSESFTINNLQRLINSDEYTTQTTNSENAVEPPLKIGSFNVQTLSNKKFSNVEVMSSVEQVILRYDLILLMEIITQDNSNMNKLLRTINRLAPKGVFYNMTLSGRHPSSNELCAFMYRTDKLAVYKSQMYEDEREQFFRKPFIVQFTASTLRDMQRFVAIGLHARPSQAVQELNALAEVYDFVKNSYRIEDILMMGDFNADCDYVKEKNWDEIALWTREEFFWPIKHNVDTTSNHRSCALDRFVYAGINMNKAVVPSSAGVFNYQEAFGLTTAEIRAVSDHWPIELQLRGNSVAEKDLFTTICVSMTDIRPVPSPSTNTLRQQIKAAGFTIVTDTANNIVLRNTSTSDSTALKALTKLHKSAPAFMSEDQLQGIAYKINYGALNDQSSHSEVPMDSFWATVSYANKINNLSVCRRTSIN